MVWSSYGRNLLFSCLLLFIASIVSAQSRTFMFVNETNADIAVTRIETAAQPLIENHQAQVVVYVVVSGGRQDFTKRLADDDIVFSTTPDNLIAIYIALEEQYSEIKWGADFDIDGGDIRSDALNPNLRSGAFEQAIVDTLHAIANDASGTGLPPILDGFVGWIEDGGVLAIAVILLVLSSVIHRLLRIFGFRGGSGTSSTYFSHDNSYHDTGSSWDSGGDSGGSDGGSWSD